MFQKIKIDVRGVALVILVLVAVTALVSCGPPPPPSVDGVTMSNAVDSSFKATNPMTSFKTGETKFFASAQVSNLIVGSKVDSRWYYNADEVTEGRTSITSDKAGSGYLAFSLSLPSGFPAGDYKVEIYLDGKLVNTTAFKVTN